MGNELRRTLLLVKLLQDVFLRMGWLAFIFLLDSPRNDYRGRLRAAAMTPSPTTSIATAIRDGLGPDFTSLARIYAECREVERRCGSTASVPVLAPELSANRGRG